MHGLPRTPRVDQTRCRPSLALTEFSVVAMATVATLHVRAAVVPIFPRLRQIGAGHVAAAGLAVVPTLGVSVRSGLNVVTTGRGLAKPSQGIGCKVKKSHVYMVASVDWSGGR